MGNSISHKSLCIKLPRSRSTIIHRNNTRAPTTTTLTTPTDNIANDTSYLDGIVWKNTIPFIPDIISAKVIKVYDGDTITVHDSQSDIYRFNVRINGIDTPEMKSTNEKEKRIAMLAQSKLSELIMNKMITMDVLCYDKYGRLLADVYYGAVRLSDWMLDQRLAVPYDGGTKTVIDDWELYNSTQ